MFDHGEDGVGGTQGAHTLVNICSPTYDCYSVVGRGTLYPHRRKTHPHPKVRVAEDMHHAIGTQTEHTDADSMRKTEGIQLRQAALPNMGMLTAASQQPGAQGAPGARKPDRQAGGRRSIKGGLEHDPRTARRTGRPRSGGRALIRTRSPRWT
jgi:hypothetical protein